MALEKSNVWWWDSHVSPENFKWVAENRQGMNGLITEMLKLIDKEETSSVTKPELIAHVKNFSNMYWSLAERYDDLTAELCKNIPSPLRVAGSLGQSKFDAIDSPPLADPDTENKTPNGDTVSSYDFCLSSGGSSDVSRKESDGSSSSSDSESVEDKALVNRDIVSYTMYRRVVELEHELHDSKTKLEVLQAKNFDDSEKEKNGLKARVLELESELRGTKQKLEVSQEEIISLQKNLKERTLSLEKITDIANKNETEILECKNEIDRLNAAIVVAAGDFETELSRCESEIKKYGEELAVVSDRFFQEKASLQAEVKGLQETVEELHIKVEKISREKCDLDDMITDLQETTMSLKFDLAKVSEEKSTLENELASLREVVSNLKAEIGDILEENLSLKVHVAEQEQIARDLKTAAASFSANSARELKEIDAKVCNLSQANASLEAKLSKTESELVQLTSEKAQSMQEHEKCVSDLSHNLVTLTMKLELLMTEKESMDSAVAALINDVGIRDDKIKDMDAHLAQLKLEHANLIVEMGSAQQANKNLATRLQELEDEVEEQKAVIADHAEGKREAIRQLCFSLDHYRDGYQQLRHLLQVNKRPLVMAT